MRFAPSVSDTNGPNRVVELVYDSCLASLIVLLALNKPWPRKYDRNHHTQVRACARRQAALCVHNQGAVSGHPGVRGKTV